MRIFPGAQRGGDAPERLIERLYRRLRRQVLGDLALAWGPPLLAALYIAAVLGRNGRIPPLAAVLLPAAVLGAALTAAVARFRRRAPTPGLAARLLDQRKDAADRFLTLATLEPASVSGALVKRLRSEAAQLAASVNLKRDFAYRIKRSFPAAAAGSVLAVVLLHLFLPLAQSRMSTPERLLELADRLARQPRFAGLAERVRAVAAKAQDPRATAEERRELAAETREQVEEQRQKERQSDERNLLGQTAAALKGLEEQAERQRNAQQPGGGGVRTELQEQGPGPGGPRQGGGDGKGEIAAQRNSALEQGKSGNTAPPPGEGEKNSGPAKSQGGNQPQPGKQEGGERPGKAQGGTEGRMGGSRPEEIPTGPPPAERFVKPGEEGKQGLKGAGYVTVQLPEELTADAAAASVGEGKAAKRARPRVPVSNTPLPVHVPDAPREKQNIPLEYRGMIR
ncbi:MAG TPA: hypothetical protein VNN77_03500 [candidate division Zixibacteria bacterium]|nr:hypothetical protein [candidate division Zixibacteria bacterium]